MKSFCCIDIDVHEKELHDTCETNLQVQAMQQATTKLVEKHGASFSVVSQLLCNQFEQMIKEAPSLTDTVQVFVTRTLQNNDSPRSITTPLSGLSGGEIEILMTLCAIHLSGADTVILDEPGHSLPPSQQAQMRRTIETQRPQDQVCVVVTHSTQFISPQSLSSLYHMSFVGRGFRPFRLRLQGQASGQSEDSTDTGEEQGSALAEEGQALGSLDAIPATGDEVAQNSQTSPRQVTFTQQTMTMLMRPDMRKMFFATGLYFVEGETDKRVLSAVRHCMMEDAGGTINTSKDAGELLQATKVLEMDRWDILALGGCSEAVKAYKAATELKIPFAIVLDLDAITVKNGKRIEPFNSANWKKSKLHKQLDKEQHSLPEAGTLLKDIEEVLKEDIQDETLLKKAQEAFQKHGFWIWAGDLEAVLCDNPDARIELQRMKSFMEAIGGKHPFSLPPGDRKLMPAKEALNNFDEKVVGPLRGLMDDLDAELSAARNKIIESPAQPVTENLKGVIAQISQKKQILSQHDNFVKKGTKRKAATELTPTVKKKKTSDNNTSNSSCATQEQTNEDATSGIAAVQASSSTNCEASRSSPVMTETQQSIFWDYAKQKLHDEGGWGRIPWETLLEVVKVCLQTEPSPLANFCRFMKRRQCKGQKRKKELPQDLLSRILPSDEEDDDD